MALLFLKTVMNVLITVKPYVYWVNKAAVKHSVFVFLPVVSGSKPGSDTSLGLGVAVGILAVVCIGVFVAAFVFYKKLFASGGSKFFRS